MAFFRVLNQLFVIKANEEVNLVIQKIVHIAESYSTNAVRMLYKISAKYSIFLLS